MVPLVFFIAVTFLVKSLFLVFFVVAATVMIGVGKACSGEKKEGEERSN